MHWFINKDKPCYPITVSDKGHCIEIGLCKRINSEHKLKRLNLRSLKTCLFITEGNW